MKAMIISVILMSAVTIVCILNFNYVRSSTKDMLDTLDRVEGVSDREGIEAFSELWNRNRNLISLTVPMQKIEAADAAVNLVLSAQRAGNEWEFIKAITLARSSINELLSYSSGGLHNIL